MGIEYERKYKATPQALDRLLASLGQSGRQIPLCEVEAELKAGDPKDVDRYGVYLQTAFGLEPETHSKFARAKMLAKGEL